MKERNDLVKDFKDFKTMKTEPAKLEDKKRILETPRTNDEDLGPLKLLPGKWVNVFDLEKPEGGGPLPGRGWNMIALPFVDSREGDDRFPFNYRLLLHRYNEELEFVLVDKAVPNRGVRLNLGPAANTDQFLVALDYQQRIRQIIGDDFPKSGLAGSPKDVIHHEPGLWLHMTNRVTEGFNIARLATIPHGDSVLALGRSSEHSGVQSIPDITGLPTGVDQDLGEAGKKEKPGNPYLAPYKHFNENLFQGVFNPVSPNDLLEKANLQFESEGGTIIRTTVLDVDSTHPTGGIVNIPFVVRQANATVMKSTFWIQEVIDKDKKPKLRLQYSQLVMLDFFKRADDLPPGCCPGLIQWPHVSINTLEKVCEPEPKK
ncbi:MAG: heme-binding protein [Nitrospira sp.]